ncbi:hypothetical protein HMSSN036_23600 [Paenibacillus macerans]|nr:hypothetical protein HMSSN036_23600 [Paenibacillus macerans]
MPTHYEDEYTTTLNKIRYLIRQVRDVNKKLEIVSRGIQNLDNGYKVRNTKQVNQKLIEVNELWQWITKQDSFTVLYSFGLSQHINNYMKFVPVIVETKNPMEKAKLIVKHLGILIDMMLEFTPELEKILLHSIERIEQSKA